MADLGFTTAIDEATGDGYLAVSLRGEELLKSPLLNKGTAFTREERDEFALHGLLPHHASTIEEQLLRVRAQNDEKPSEIQKNIYLNGLQDRNETLFYRFIIEYLEDIVPIIYTPTVAHVCEHWSKIFRRARGTFITPGDRGRMAQALRSRPKADRPVIVVTDNERILGIGDQGAGGMGIPIGKLALYAAAAGIHPSRLVPVSLDVGTNNLTLLDDPMYLGYRDRRIDGARVRRLHCRVRYRGQRGLSGCPAAVGGLRQPDELLEPRDLPQGDSFVQRRYSGTAAMAVAGLLAATRSIGGRMRDHRVVIVGAGSAGIGIRELIALAMAEDGATKAEIDSQLFVLDSRGLVVDGRPGLSPGKLHVSVPTGVITDWQITDHPIGLEDVVRNARATVLIGVSGVAGIFTQEIVGRVARYTERPIILPLSNPTSHTEVTPVDALSWTGGTCPRRHREPLPAGVSLGHYHYIGQANNVFVFPGIGLGSLAVRATTVTNGMLLAAAHALPARSATTCCGVARYSRRSPRCEMSHWLLHGP